MTIKCPIETFLSVEPQPKPDQVLDDFHFASAIGQPAYSHDSVDAPLSLFCPDGAEIEVPSDIVRYKKTQGLLSLIEDKAIQDVGAYIQRTVWLFMRLHIFKTQNNLLNPVWRKTE